LKLSRHKKTNNVESETSQFHRNRVELVVARGCRERRKRGMGKKGEMLIQGDQVSIRLEE
jgi:hypothetical protein